MTIKEVKTFPLTLENIDEFSRSAYSFFLSVKKDKKIAIRARLSAEETLMQWYNKLGEGVEVTCTLRLKLLAPQILISYTGEKTDPYCKDSLADADDELAAAGHSILSKTGFVPKFIYKNGVNYVIISPEKTSTLKTLVLPVILGLIFGIICNLLPQGLSETISSDFLHPIFSAIISCFVLISLPIIATQIVTSIVNSGKLADISIVGGYILRRYFGKVVIIALMCMVVIIPFMYLSDNVTMDESSSVNSVLDFGLDEVTDNSGVYKTALGGIVNPANHTAIYQNNLGNPSNSEKIQSNNQSSSSLNQIEFGKFFVYLEKNVPDNFVSPFLDNNIFQVFFVAILVGLAVLTLSTEVPAKIVLIDQINKILLLILDWFCKLMPLLLFTGMAIIVLNSTLDIIFPTIAAYLIVGGFAVLVCIGLAIETSVKFKIPVSLIYARMKPALIAAISMSPFSAYSQSIAVCTKDFGIDATFTKTVLPIGIVMLKTGTLLSSIFAILFLILAYNCTITFVTLIVLFFTLVIIAPSIDDGSVIILFSIFLEVLGLPIELMALLLCTSALIDVVLTPVTIFTANLDLFHVAKKFGYVKQKDKGI